MFRIFLLSFIFLTENGIYGTYGQTSEGVPCETPNEEYGLCISIYDCAPLMNLLITQSNNQRVRTFLRASACGYLKNNVPLVCCTQTTTPNILNPTPTQNIVNPTPSPTTQTPINRTPRLNNIYTLPRRGQCGHANSTNPTRIVNGVPAKLGEFPWIVALGYKNSKNPDVPKWLCGGTLITDRHVLTAGHCVYNRPDLYTARVGDLDLYSDNDGAHPETIPLIKAKIHENFSPVNFTNDIAILTLAKSPKKETAWPVCLPIEDDLRKSDFSGSRPTVAGWGSTSFNGPSSPALLEVVLPVVDNERCKKAYGTRSVIDNRVLCAGYLTGGKDACQGDSGGPLMHRINTGDSNIWFYQIGVVSYGLRCAEAGYPGVYTRVTAFLDWIQNNIE